MLNNPIEIVDQALGMMTIVIWVGVFIVGAITALVGLFSTWNSSPLLLFIGAPMFFIGLIKVIRLSKIPFSDLMDIPYKKSNDENNILKKQTHSVMCQDCVAGKVTCRSCHGMRGSGGTEGTCYTCNGTGKVKCPKCKGEGFYEY